LRVRSVETIVQAALETYRNTGYQEISLLSLSTSDYPHFTELVERMHQVFAPLGVSVSLPSLRVNSHFPQLPKLMKGIRKSGMTLAPEVARDDMRTQIRKPIKNEDLFEGCKNAFAEGWQKIKLYFLCGLRGDRRVSPALLEAWRRGARLDGWRENFKPELWWQVLADLNIDFAWYSQRYRPVTEVLPWDHINVKKGREYLEKEQKRSLVQLE